MTEVQRERLERLDAALETKIQKARSEYVTTPVYLADVLLLCTQCQQPIKARINTQQWIRVEWIGPSGECLSCYQKAKDERQPQRQRETVTGA